MKKILLTGFKPFDHEALNPTEEFIKKITQENLLSRFTNLQVQTLILPVEYKKSFSLLQSAIEEKMSREPPFDLILMLGQASGREGLHLERVALNWLQAQIADESGCKPTPQSIESEKPLALMTQFEVDHLQQYLITKNIQATISFSAGAYVCNHLYFQTLSNYPQVPSLFIHVPLLTEQASAAAMKAKPSMSLTEMTNQLLLVFEYLNLES